mmetsp:Transcript_68045/g.121157  ORF Transcript_68045/g.121157 Transcript_68045/m.121157 type:complete len:211 (+) Transcript_68045:42-674(+)
MVQTDGSSRRHRSRSRGGGGTGKDKSRVKDGDRRRRRSPSAEAPDSGERAAARESSSAGGAVRRSGDAPKSRDLDIGENGVPRGIEDVPLNVSSCIDETISKTIHGTYAAHSMHDGKVVYKKQESSQGLDVLIYYWNDSDNPELSGWWFGPSIGGDLVWAFHPSRKAITPPMADWNVPHDGPIDKTFSVKVPLEFRRALEEEKRRAGVVR